MALRFVQIFLPDGDAGEIGELLEGFEVLGVWRDAGVETKLVAHVLAPAERTEEITDELERRFSGRQGFHVVVFPVEAVLPRPPSKAPEEPKTAEEAAEAEAERARKELRVSREELYNEVADSLGANRVFVAMAVLSTVVAAIGLARNDLAAIIGAMVIAPLLGPNVAMSLAVTLGDVELLRRAARTNLIGVAAALAAAVTVGLLISADPSTPAIADRTRVGYADIALALGAGAAGSLAYTRGLAGAVIGVMVAVALVPPLAVFGLLLGQGAPRPALGALALTATNVICLNLAGTAAFVLQGVRPRNWWEAKRAKQATRRALLLGVALLALLTMLIYWTNRWNLAAGPID